MTIALPGVIAVVTGAAGAVGHAVVRAMSEAGASVIATDISEVPDGLGANHTVRHDVTCEHDWQAVAALAGRHFGRIDALVNLAAISVVGKIEDTPLAEWRRVSAINLDSVILGVQTLLPLLREGGRFRKGGASIVNFSSIAGLRAATFNAAYCTSKAGVAMLSKCMGAEFAALGYNIRCNSIHPGGLESPMLAGIMEGYVAAGATASSESAARSMVRRYPIGRLGRPEEMGGGVVFLCSEAASFVTCSEFLIDGGFTQV
jgi:NAD(P)-dependent dehydrogenase (short-subunit alcohol dehydrogenase family)